MNDASRGGPHEPELIDADSLDFGLGVAFAGDGRRPGEGVSAAIERMTGGASRVLLRDDHDAPSPILRLLPAGSAERIGDDGRYQVMGEIARGGLGVVLKGRDRDLGRDVALKVLRPEFAKNDAVLARFIEEAQIGGQLQHPGIVPVYSLGIESEGRPFFAMKLVKGRTLAALLVDRKSPRDGQRRILAVFEQVCRTMAYAHSRRVVHRDLKPSNVMLGAFGEIQVVDWGLAKVLGREDVPSVRPVAADAPEISLIATVRSGSAGSGSLAGSVLGTPGYMSPEQAIGRVEDVDERTDVFALGAILCEILTGQPPFTGEARDQIVLAARANLDDAAARLAKCGADPAIVAVALKCLAAERGERYHDASVLADAVTAHLSGIEARARRAEVAAAVARAKAEEERAAATRERVTAVAARGAHRRTIALAAVVLTGVAAGVVVWRREAANESERAAHAVAAVSSALAEANAKRGAKDVVGALAAAQKAVALAKTGETDEETAAQAARLVASLEADDRAASAASAAESKTAALFARLAGIEGWGRAADRESWCDAQAAAFREFGADVAAEDEQAAVVVIRLSSRSVDIAGALDDWACGARWAGLAATTPSPRVDALLPRIDRLADTADPDPFRRQVRDAMRRRDLVALRALVSQSGVEKLPVRTRTLLGSLLSQLGDHKAAYAVLASAARTHPGDYATANVLVAALDQLDPEHGDRDESVALRVAQLALAPCHRSWEELGYGHYRNEEYDASIAALHEALRLQDCARSVGFLGTALWSAGKKDDAMKALDRAIAADPSQTYSYFPHLIRGNLFQESKDYVHAAEATRKSIELQPDWPSGHQNLGDQLYLMGDFKGAAAAYREASRLNPKDSYACRWLVATLVRMNDLDAAVAESRRAMDRFPKDRDVLWNFVFALTSKIREELEVSRDESSKHADDTVVQARTLASIDEAAGLCRSALTSAPRDAYLHECLGNLLGMRAQVTGDFWYDAVAEFRAAVRLAPAVPSFHTTLGNALWADGDNEEAVAECRRAVQLGDRSQFAQSELALALWFARQMGEAIDEAKKGLALFPEDLALQSTLSGVMEDECLSGKRDDWGAVLAALRRTHEIFAKLAYPTWRDRGTDKSTAWAITMCEAILDPAFPERVRSGHTPADPDEAELVVEVCRHRKMNVAGVKCALDALAADPDVSDTNSRYVRDNGAAMAVLAADGRGEGADALDAAARLALRRQALGWMREVLALDVARMRGPKRTEATNALHELLDWLEDSALAPVRDPDALARLSIDDRVAWERFWAEVDRALREWSKRKR